MYLDVVSDCGLPSKPTREQRNWQWMVLPNARYVGWLAAGRAHSVSRKRIKDIILFSQMVGHNKDSFFDSLMGF